MLCPSCLVDVDRFDAEHPQRANPGYKCPQCKEPVPENYVKDFKQYPPVVFFLLGMPGHGKSLYLARLFHEFETVGRKWLEFFYTPIQERFLESIRVRQHALERGIIPDSADKLFAKPAVVRLDGVPGLGKCQLILYDYRADAEPDPRDQRFTMGYFGRNKMVVLLLSLKDVKSPAELTDLLTRYSETVAKMGGNTHDQTLIVALTKSDLLLEMDDLPEYIRNSIHGDFSSSDESTDVLGELSGIIETWLGTHKTTMNFIRGAKAEFREVLFTTTVAAIPDAGRISQTTDIKPGVWWPLRLAWRTQQPLMKQEQQRKIKKKIGQVAKDTISGATSGIFGGILGLIEGAVWGAALWGLAGGFEAYVNQVHSPEILNFALKQGVWGILWGALIWMLAGMIDTVRGSGAFIRNGVRLGAGVWFLANALISSVIWGLTLTSFAMLKQNAAFSTGMLTKNALLGAAYGGRLGALLGALWGLIVKSVGDVELRDPSGMTWSLLVASLVSVVVHLLANLNMLHTNLVWSAVALIVFTLWSGIRNK